MKIQNFTEAKRLCHEIVKKHNLKNMDDWKNFVNSPSFKEYSKYLPKNPEVYYSKKNVIKRMKR